MFPQAILDDLVARLHALESRTPGPKLPGDLPPRVLDKLLANAGVSTYHPDGDQAAKLHIFARLVLAEAAAR
jgi:hypothetical protein